MVITGRPVMSATSATRSAITGTTSIMPSPAQRPSTIRSLEVRSASVSRSRLATGVDHDRVLAEVPRQRVDQQAGPQQVHRPAAVERVEPGDVAEIDDGLRKRGLGREMTLDGVQHLGDVEPHVPSPSAHTSSGLGARPSSSAVRRTQAEAVQVGLGALGRLGAREQVALAEPAPGCPHHVEVGRRLQALGHHVDAEPPAQARP